MLEKVLKRLCPCYFGRTDEQDLAGCPTIRNKCSDIKETTSVRSSDSNTKNITSESDRLENTWKGTLNIVQPQPIYALPGDLRKPAKRNQKNLLKPPLYWKKTKKSLCTEGPPVFQQLKRKKFSCGNDKDEKRKHGKEVPHKHSGTTGDLTSLPSATTINIKWLKSQSNLTEHKEISNGKKEFSLYNPHGVSTLEGLKYESGRRDWSCLKCQVLQDVSHGVILFTAAYFNKKKMLENLSKKGREGNSYYTVVKLAVLPSERYIRCTRVLANCISPEVKQDFSFSVKELSGKVLRLSVFDASLQKQHEAVGHALLTLEDIICDQPKKYRIKLYRRTQPHICPGNLALSLKYSHEKDRFTVVVVKGRNLSLQRDKNVKLNTYVKVTMYAYGEKVKTKKSLVVFHSRDPNYNSTFTFQVRNDQVDHLSVAVLVRLKGFVNDATIGRLNFGPFFYGENQTLTSWGRVFLNKETVSHWYRMYL
ncbi:hypothetical protein RUM44_009047 [Polyplax serrata]|uniref:C2 domain-containing protein n=1 Tax=Polyplax serrata TaxID=468196 RepID=A0ABR1AT36_POLSC